MATFINFLQPKRISQYPKTTARCTVVTLPLFQTKRSTSSWFQGVYIMQQHEILLCIILQVQGNHAKIFVILLGRIWSFPFFLTYFFLVYVDGYFRNGGYYWLNNKLFYNFSNHGSWMNNGKIQIQKIEVNIIKFKIISSIWTWRQCILSLVSWISNRKAMCCAQ